MNLEAVYGDGTRAATATAVLDVLPRLARFSDLFGPNPAAEMLVIDRPVLLDIDATVLGLEIVTGGVLEFDPNRTVTLRSDAHSVCVQGGTLRMRPSTADVVHTLRFVNIDETRFVGGAGGDHETDPGLCVMDQGGTIDFLGAAKRGWTRATAGLAAGQVSFDVADASGWRAGDELVVAPTEPASVADHSLHFDRLRVGAVVGDTVTLVSPLAWPHPVNTAPDGTVIFPEVANLTRNVVISGDTEHGALGAARTTGRAHIMHMPATGPCSFTWRYVEIMHMGPRQTVPGKSYTDLVLGRYGLHWHRMADATRGTLVEGVSVHDVGARAFVPHGSHGITLRDCVAFSAFDAGYWWDTGQDADRALDRSHDTFYDRCLSGWTRKDSSGGAEMSSFLLAAGQNVKAHGCTAWGVEGGTNASGYHWPSLTNNMPDNVWDFADCDTHNHKVDGTFVWQNDSNPDHVVLRLRAFNNGDVGIKHGAYTNAYRYQDCQAWGNATTDFAELAQSTYPSKARTGPPITIHGGALPVVSVEHHRLLGNSPTLFESVVIGRVVVDEVQAGGGSNPGLVDFVDCGLPPGAFTLTSIDPGSVIRVQNGSQAWRITASGPQSIPAFTPFRG